LRNSAHLSRGALTLLTAYTLYQESPVLLTGGRVPSSCCWPVDTCDNSSF